MKKVVKGKKTESIIPQAKLLRLFQIIAVLKSGHWTIKQLADRFDTSERTIYRYLNLLEEVDFLIEKDFENRYFIITSEDDPLQAQFSVEETRLIKKLIISGTNDNPLKNSLLKKLSLNSEIDRDYAVSFFNTELGSIFIRCDIVSFSTHSVHPTKYRSI